MTIDVLLEKLAGLKDNTDPEAAHAWADDALLEFIDDTRVTKAFSEIEKNYA